MYKESDSLLMDINRSIDIINDLIKDELDHERIAFFRGKVDAYEDMRNLILLFYQV